MKTNRRNFIQSSAAFAGLSILPGRIWANSPNSKIGIAYIGVGKRGAGVMGSIANHKMAECIAICDTDSNNLKKATQRFSGVPTFTDYRKMLLTLGDKIDAVMVATPDHTHAPAAMLAMELGKHVYCEKPLTHGIAEAYEMNAISKEKGLSTQMGTQLHSSQAYRTLTHYLQDGVIGKVSRIYGWSNKNWGYDGAMPTGPDPVPEELNWNLWLGTAAERPYWKGFYHPSRWRRMTDFGNGTLGDMGVHIFDPVMSSLNLGQPTKITTKCRESNGFSQPEGSTVEYEFTGTEYTESKVNFTWFDGKHTPKTDTDIVDLQMEGDRKLPTQGAMFIGENGKRCLLSHGSGPQFLPRSMHATLTKPKIQSLNHYSQWVDAAMGNGKKCNVDFDYAETLTSTVLLGVLGNRFPGQELHWDAAKMRFTNNEAANQLVHKTYRKGF